MSVAEARLRISSREFAEWRAYDLREPIGPERSDLMAAIIAATVANSTGRMKRPLKPADFLPKYGVRKRQSPGDMMNRLKLAARLGAEAKRLREERARKALERKQAKKPAAPPQVDHGQRGHRQRQVRSTDRRL